MERPEQHRGSAPPARSREQRVLAGVCGGLARRTDIDPIVYRVTFGVLGCLGVGVLLYGAAWALLPRDDRDRSEVERWIRRRVDGPAVLAILVALLVVPGLLAPDSLGPPTIGLIVVLSIAALSAHQRGADLAGALRAVPGRLTFSRLAPEETTPQDEPPAYQPPGPARAYTPYGPPPSPAPPGAGEAPTAEYPTAEYPTAGYATGRYQSSPYGHATEPYPPGPYGYGEERPAEGSGRGPLLMLLTLGVTFVVAGVLTTVAATGSAQLAPELILAAAVTTIGCGLVLGTWYGRGRPLIAAGLVASIVLVAAAAVTLPSRESLLLNEGVGERSWQPREEIRQPYRLGVGEATLDLTDLRTGGSYDYTASIGAGELRVRVPSDIRAVVHVAVGMGDAIIVNERIDGDPGITTTRTLPATQRTGTKDAVTTVELNLDVTLGDVRVIRVSP